MKSGSSSLNPYAASYVPLFKRGVADVNREFNSAQELNSGNQFGQYVHQPVNASPQGQHRNFSQNYAPAAGPMQTPQFPNWMDHRGTEFVASTSHPNEVSEKSHFDEDFDMDLAYLQMTFPGISEESLSDVYLANRCDLDASVDMLTQLENHPDDSSDKLPDTLDIGDVPESHEVKNTKVEAGASKSGLSNMPSKR